VSSAIPVRDNSLRWVFAPPTHPPQLPVERINRSLPFCVYPHLDVLLLAPADLCFQAIQRAWKRCPAPSSPEALASAPHQWHRQPARRRRQGLPAYPPCRLAWDRFGGASVRYCQVRQLPEVANAVPGGIVRAQVYRCVGAFLCCCCRGSQPRYPIVTSSPASL